MLIFICMYVCMYVYLSVCLSVCLFVCLCTYVWLCVIMCDYVWLCVCARLGSCVLFQYNSFLQTLPMKALRSPQTQPSLNDPKNSYRIDTGREQECPKIVSCCCPSHVLHPEKYLYNLGKGNTWIRHFQLRDQDWQHGDLCSLEWAIGRAWLQVRRTGCKSSYCNRNCRECYTELAVVVLTASNSWFTDHLVSYEIYS